MSDLWLPELLQSLLCCHCKVREVKAELRGTEHCQWSESICFNCVFLVGICSVSSTAWSSLWCVKGPCLKLWSWIGRSITRCTGMHFFSSLDLIIHLLAWNPTHQLLAWTNNLVISCFAQRRLSNPIISHFQSKCGSSIGFSLKTRALLTCITDGSSIAFYRWAHILVSHSAIQISTQLYAIRESNVWPFTLWHCREKLPQNGGRMTSGCSRTDLYGGLRRSTHTCMGALRMKRRRRKSRSLARKAA